MSTWPWNAHPVALARRRWARYLMSVVLVAGFVADAGVATAADAVVRAKPSRRRKPHRKRSFGTPGVTTTKTGASRLVETTTTAPSASAATRSPTRTVATPPTQNAAATPTEQAFGTRAPQEAGPPLAIPTVATRAMTLRIGSLSRAERDAPTASSPGGSADAPTFYAAAFASTTFAYRAYRGTLEGPVGDVSPNIGLGYLVSQKLAIELDVGPTFVAGTYVSMSLTPGVVWAFHPNVYAASRFIVPVHPEVNFALYPGIGATHAFGALAPFLELSVISYVGRGEPDFGLGASAGALYPF